MIKCPRCNGQVTSDTCFDDFGYPFSTLYVCECGYERFIEHTEKEHHEIEEEESNGWNKFEKAYED